uniref:Carbohydrate sulfotransferase n=2 Tax=Culex tarsalis TaxID=7177 RepID=A0A1Q3EUU8_CULTA
MCSIHLISLIEQFVWIPFEKASSLLSPHFVVWSRPVCVCAAAMATSGASNNQKRHLAVAAMFVAVVLLAFCTSFRSVSIPFFQHGIRPTRSSSSGLLQYVRRVCRVQFQGWTSTTVSGQQTPRSMPEPVSTVRWCKTLDGNVTFAGRGRFERGWIERIAREIEPNSLLMLVEHPLVRVARFYRDALREVHPKSPFWPLAVDIKAHQRDRNIHTPPSFAQFLTFVIDLRRSVHPLGFHWQPYATLCQPCLLRYDAIVRLDEPNDATQRAEVDQLATLYGDGMDESLLERTDDFYRDDLMLLNYSVDRFYRELYKNFHAVIVQVRPS